MNANSLSSTENQTKPLGHTQTHSFLSIDSKILLDGQKEIHIEHAGEFYRLQVTKSNKLILIK